MAEQTREQRILEKLAALKSATAPNAAQARWELALAVFDSNADGNISDRDTSLARWRGGLGLNSKTKIDTRTEVENALGIKGLDDSEDIAAALAKIKPGPAAAKPKETPAKPLTADSGLADHLRDYESARAQARPGRMAALRASTRGLLKKFFDLNGDGNVTEGEIKESVSQINNWKKLRAAVSGGPTAEDLEPIEKLIGMRDGDGKKVETTMADIAKKLKEHGLNVTPGEEADKKVIPRIRPMQPPSRQ